MTNRLKTSAPTFTKTYLLRMYLRFIFISLIHIAQSPTGLIVNCVHVMISIHPNTEQYTTSMPHDDSRLSPHGQIAIAGRAASDWPAACVEHVTSINRALYLVYRRHEVGARFALRINVS